MYIYIYIYILYTYTYVFIYICIPAAAVKAMGASGTENEATSCIGPWAVRVRAVGLNIKKSTRSQQSTQFGSRIKLQCIAVCCSVLQCVAVCCSVL